MLLQRLSFSTIRARISYLIMLGILLITIVTIVNEFMDHKRSQTMDIERLCHNISLMVTQGMMVEAQYMVAQDDSLIKELNKLRADVAREISEIETHAPSKSILALVQGMADKQKEHASLFKLVGNNLDEINKARKDMAAILARTNSLANEIIQGINQKEVELLMDQGASLDYTHVALRSEIKDIQRVVDQFKANLDNLFLLGNVEEYTDRSLETKETIKLRQSNAQTALNTMEHGDFEEQWLGILETIPQFQELETKIAEKWKENSDRIDPLKHSQQEMLRASGKIADLAEATIEKSEQIKKIVTWSVSIAGIAALFIMGGLIARSIVTPVNRVVHGLADISQGSGDLTFRLPHSDNGEMGRLARSFNLFMDNQRAMVQEIAKVADSLSAYTADVNSTATQLATSALEGTTTVMEVSTTTEEVKQTVTLSSEKADQVTRDADNMMAVSHRGLKVTEESAASMDFIRQEMERIAKAIVKLSEQTQNIGEIINAVNELANQSDLLSVNASIEAAKAGDYGRGFTVVAREVKNLANQSKHSTQQVRQILSEIHEATNEAIRAAERGAKAVENGVTLSSESGSSIQKLSHSIETSVRSAQQIASSCRQQLAGMEQLDMAMRGIKDSSRENLESSRRLEQLTQGLQDLGTALDDQTKRFIL